MVCFKALQLFPSQPQKKSQANFSEVYKKVQLSSMIIVDVCLQNTRTKHLNVGVGGESTKDMGKLGTSVSARAYEPNPSDLKHIFSSIVTHNCTFEFEFDIYMYIYIFFLKARKKFTL